MKINAQGLLLFFCFLIYNLLGLSFNAQIFTVLFLCALPLLYMEWKKEFPIIQIWSLLNYYYYFQPLINKVPAARGSLSPEIDVVAMSLLLNSQLIISLLYVYYKVFLDKFYTSVWIFHNKTHSRSNNKLESSRLISLVVFIELISRLNFLSSFVVLFIFNRVVITTIVSYFLVYERSVFFRNKLLLVALAQVIFNIVSVFLDGLIVAMIISVLPLLYYFLYKGKYLLVIFSFFVAYPLVSKFNDIKVEFRQLTWYSGEISLAEKLEVLNNLLFSDNEVSSNIGPQFSSSDIRRAHSYHYFQRALYEHNNGKSYLLGSSYWIILTKPIPRILWLEKPREESGSVISKQYGMLDQTDYNTSMNLPFWVELYINFGKYGLYIGSLLITLFFIYLSKKTMINGDNYLDTGVKFALVIPFLGIESNLSLMVGGFMGLIVFGILNKLFVKNRIVSNLRLN
jgi:hypothetical protein